METGACLDATGVYRYSLWRLWNPQAPRLVFVMLNPSTADAQVDDPTIRRCLGFAQTWGYGGLEVVNLFGFRASHPRLLATVPDPVGAECDRFIQRAAQQAERIILAWGNWGSFAGRDQAVMKLLTAHNLYCLGRNQTGQPCHPLYLKRDVEPVLYANSKPTASSVPNRAVGNLPGRALRRGGSVQRGDSIPSGVGNVPET